MSKGLNNFSTHCMWYDTYGSQVRLNGWRIGGGQNVAQGGDLTAHTTKGMEYFQVVTGHGIQENFDICIGLFSSISTEVMQISFVIVFCIFISFLIGTAIEHWGGTCPPPCPFLRCPPLFCRKNTVQLPLVLEDSNKARSLYRRLHPLKKILDLPLVS